MASFASASLWLLGLGLRPAGLSWWRRGVPPLRFGSSAPAFACRAPRALVSTMVEVAVVGGGVAGLGAALALARRGHSVTVFERDDTPMPRFGRRGVRLGSPRCAAGAPQPRLPRPPRGIAETDYADIYQQLLDEGATEMPFGVDLPPTMTNFEREPADDDLVMLACRRTTFEWVLRRAALAEGRVEFRTGLAVVGLIAEQASDPRACHRGPARRRQRLRRRSGRRRHRSAQCPS